MQSTPTAPVRGRPRRGAAALLLALPLLGGILPGPAAAAPAAAASAAAPAAPAGATSSGAPTAAAAPTGSHTADLSVNELTPSVPGEGDTVTVSGTVTNKGDSAITGGHIGLRVGPAMNSRSAVEQSAKRTGFLAGADAPEVQGGPRAKVGSIAPGITQPFTLKVPVEDLGLGESGVYQLGVSLTAKTKARPYDQVLGIKRTFLPWQPSDAREKTRLTFMWPLISSSHLTARTESDEQQTPVFQNDDLARAIAPGGRLQQMVALGADLPITWVIDPDLLASVDAMTKPYEVRTEDGGTVPGKQQALANEWLKSLQEAVVGEDVVALPFADPDLASLAHHGTKVPGTLGRLGPATEVASGTVETTLHTEPNTDFAWPVEGQVDTSVIDVATSAGAHNVIARSDSFAENVSIPYTPSAARPIGGGTTAVVADHVLSTAFKGDLTRAGKSTLAVQRFLAHTLAITQQVPGKQRSVVVAPQRQPSASEAQAMAAALNALADSGRWAQETGLPAAAKAKPDPAANRSVPRPGSYPDRLRKQELPVEAFRALRSTETKLDDFAEILSQPDRVEAPFHTAIDRQVSTSWRGDAEGARAFRESLHDYLIGLTRKVKLIKKSNLTLSGRSATVPVTVQNNLAQGVDGLKLKLTSSRSIGLEIENDTQQVVVDGGHSQSVKFDTSAKANGRTSVTAQLYTEEGKAYGPPMRFQVKVTSITSTVLLVIAGGVLLVVLAGIRMYTQRKRRGTAPDPDAPLEPAPGEEPSQKGNGGPANGPAGGPDTGAGTATPEENFGQRPGAASADAADTQQPGERNGDITPESGGPQDTGERVDR